MLLSQPFDFKVLLDDLFVRHNLVLEVVLLDEPAEVPQLFLGDPASAVEKVFVLVPPAVELLLIFVDFGHTFSLRVQADDSAVVLAVFQFGLGGRRAVPASVLLGLRRAPAQVPLRHQAVQRQQLFRSKHTVRIHARGS